MPRKPSPTFEIVFRGPGILPEAISFRKLADAVNAINKLATIGQAVQDEEDSFRLIGITRGSAALQCYAPDDERSIDNLRQTGLMLESGQLPEDAGARVRPIEELSRIARSLGCSIVVRKDRSDVLATIVSDSYDNLKRSHLVTGETTLSGTVERVGGATNLRCVLRLAGRRELLYCDVGSKELARLLGEHLYEDVVVSGVAQWFKTDWRIVGFRIKIVSQTCRKPLKERFRLLHDAGGSAWDKIDDPDEYLQAMRGAS